MSSQSLDFPGWGHFDESPLKGNLSVFNRFGPVERLTCLSPTSVLGNSTIMKVIAAMKN